MTTYLKYASAERARLRHAAFAKSQIRQIAFEILQKQTGIVGIKQGPESFLLFLEPEANLDNICGELEKAIPEINANAGKVPQSPSKPKHPHRKAILKAYLATGITTVTLAACGFYHWHKVFAWVFTAFAVDHVWVRRKAL